MRTIREKAAPGRSRMPAGQRRDVVVAAAGRCFGVGGYEGTTIEQIAAEAGVTKPIVYRHFESKQALYLALLEKHREDLPSFLEGIEIEPGDPPETALRRIFERWFDYIAVNSHAWEMLFRDSTGGPEIQAFRREVSRRAHEVIAGFIRATGSAIDDAQVEPTAQLLTSGLAGLVLWSIDHPEVDRSILIEVALRMSTPAFEG